LAEAVHVAEDLSTASLGTLLTAYKEGLYVLPGVLDYTTDPPDADRIRLFLRLARRLFDYIIVDTGELQGGGPCITRTHTGLARSVSDIQIPSSPLGEQNHTGGKNHTGT